MRTDRCRPEGISPEPGLLVIRMLAHTGDVSECVCVCVSVCECICVYVCECV